MDEQKMLFNFHEFWLRYRSRKFVCMEQKFEWLILIVAFLFTTSSDKSKIEEAMLKADEAVGVKEELDLSIN